MRLAADGTPWFPPLTDQQRASLRRRTLMVEVSYDPDEHGYPFLDIVPIINAGLPDGMHVAGLRGATSEWGINDVRINRAGEVYEHPAYAPDDD